MYTHVHPHVYGMTIACTHRYDEATRLEADALLGTPRPRRVSDPVGEPSRRSRIMYHYR